MDKVQLNKIAVTSFIIFYFFFGIFNHLHDPKNEEIFPFFSWFLFWKVPPESQIRYTVIITGIENKKLPEPELYNKSTRIIPNSKIFTADELIQNMGSSFMHQQYDSFSKIKSVFEKNYLLPNTDYELAGIYYNPVEFYTDNKYKIKVIKYFTYHE